MKLKNGWILTEMDGEYVVVPTGESAESFNGIVRLNETGKDIWQWLTEGLDEDAIAEKIVLNYEDVDITKAKESVKTVIDKLKNEGILSNE